MSDATRQSVADFIHEELAAIDERRWDDWLACFAEDAEFWVPAWDSELVQTDDPASQISLIYYPSRAGLADRVFRLRTNQSSASTPLPRTCHMVSNMRITALAGGVVQVKAAWQAHSYRLETATSFFGHYQYELAASAGTWRIQKKKIIILNDLIPTVLDIYSI